MKKDKTTNILEANKGKIEIKKVGKKQYLRAELQKITTMRFCLRHNVNSIEEYQEKLKEYPLIVLEKRLMKMKYKI